MRNVQSEQGTHLGKGQLWPGNSVINIAQRLSNQHGAIDVQPHNTLILESHSSNGNRIGFVVHEVGQELGERSNRAVIDGRVVTCRFARECSCRDVELVNVGVEDPVGVKAVGLGAVSKRADLEVYALI